MFANLCTVKCFVLRSRSINQLIKQWKKGLIGSCNIEKNDKNAILRIHISSGVRLEFFFFFFLGLSGVLDQKHEFNKA